MYTVRENMFKKEFRSEEFNYNFDKITGYTELWGKTKEEDPTWSPYGPVILDIEVSTQCSNHGNCKSCYKSNTSNGSNMSIDTFKQVIDKIRATHTLTQLAFGIGNITANPDLFLMTEYARSVGIIPNITINGSKMTSTYYDSLAKYMGAVAVSRYNRDTCYNAVYELTKRGLSQVNIHQILSAESYESCFQVIDDIKEDYRLEKLGAVVFLILKPKGRASIDQQLKDKNKYKKLIDYAFEKEVSFGMDSCEAPYFQEAISSRQDYSQLMQSVSSCESTCESLYINCDAKVFPCSFTEGTKGWEEGLDILSCNNFLEDIWLNPKVQEFRNKLFDSCEKNGHGCRECPIYDLRME